MSDPVRVPLPVSRPVRVPMVNAGGGGMAAANIRAARAFAVTVSDGCRATASSAATAEAACVTGVPAVAAALTAATPGNAFVFPDVLTVAPGSAAPMMETAAMAWMAADGCRAVLAAVAAGTVAAAAAA